MQRLKTRTPRIAVVGATGAVGVEIESVLRKRRFPAASFRLFGSSRSVGRTIEWNGRQTQIEELGPNAFNGVDLAFFSAGASVSREYGPAAVRAGAIVVDNSSAFRMDSNIPLVVPEVNPDALEAHAGIIANPNCSAIILLMPLAPLHRRWTALRVVISTYQAVSGAGARAIAELEEQSREVLSGRDAVPQVFREPCAFNVFSHNTPVGEDGLNGEERKMVEESRKILGAPELRVSPTCIRVPVKRAHTESITVEFQESVDPEAARELLRGAPGIEIVDDVAAGVFPTPLRAAGRDPVLVGRIRTDASIPDRRGLAFICAGDQLRKGAALNAVQIAERLLPA